MTPDSNLLPPELADDRNDKHFVPAPCQIACPVGTDAPSYIAHIWEGKFDEAFEAITATNPFSSICGRVCDAPCEPACRRTASDGPLQIRNLKRFVMDKLGRSWRPTPAPTTRKESVGIVGAGPAGLVAAHDLAVAGFKVDVYEMTDRAGGMMVWGIPAFRLPPGIIDEDMDRLAARCPGLAIHTGVALGRDIGLDQLKARHDAVALTIGSWWGKRMGIPGEDDERVIDGVEFLRRVNAGARPTLPATVVVIGGGDVAMDACRVALRLPGCQHVKVIYRRGPDDIPARRIELEGAIAEGIEFVYNTQQVAIAPAGNQLKLTCVNTTAGEPDADGRRRPLPLADSEHDISCGMVIAAVGQFGALDDAAARPLMDADRVKTSWQTMRTGDPKVFAAGDGAFGGSTIVMAMGHGQRLAYYIKAFLDGDDNPAPYRTPWRTRRVPVAQDLSWEKFPLHHPEFHGVGANPVAFPEIESTYGWQQARNEAARCYRCDAETGSADYSVRHREDIFLMARMKKDDTVRQAGMLAKRLALRDNPFPASRPPTVDDLVFLPANLSRLVIDPYREACKVATELGGGRMDIAQPFFATGFDDAPAAVRAGVAAGLKGVAAGYIGARPLGPAPGGVPWLQLLAAGDAKGSSDAAALIATVGPGQPPPASLRRQRDDQLLGLSVADPAALEQAILFGLQHGFDLLLLNGNGPGPWPELKGAPDLAIMRDAIRILRRENREEEIDLLWFGGIRSGTDAAKLIAMGAKSVIVAMPVAFAAGGEIQDDGHLAFAPDLGEDERARAVANILKSASGEASMMARCTGKTNLHNLEPEDLRALTLATAQATGLLLAGKH